jgi:hypothetical protein
MRRYFFCILLIAIGFLGLPSASFAQPSEIQSLKERARAGNNQAQFDLGMAYMWMSIALSNWNDLGYDDWKELDNRLSDDQKKEADRKMDAWIKANPKCCY